MESGSVYEIYDSIIDGVSTDAVRLKLLALAEAGSAEAQFYLGHLADEASPRKPSEALAWYRQAAAGGFAEAKHWVASFMYFGMGTTQDVAAAVALFRECASEGQSASQWKLGQHLLQFPESRAEAVSWLQRAAEQGHSGATELLAGVSRHGA